MIPLHLKHLETFFWAAKLGSFTAAAKRVHFTQSAVSMRIAELEQRFGTALFQRSHRKIRLTSKGEELMVYVERVLNLMSEIQERITSSETIGGTVRIGVTEVVAQTWLPTFVRALHQRFPRVTVTFEVALALEVIGKLRTGAVDLILSPCRTFESDLVAQSLGAVDFRWMASPSLGLPKRALSAQDLQNQRIIVLPKESHHYYSIEQWFRSNKAICRPSDICNSMGVVSSLTMTDLGISLLPPLCYRQELESGQLVVLDTVPPHRPVEFFAIKSAADFDPLKQLVTDLAVEISTFPRLRARAATSATRRMEKT